MKVVVKYNDNEDWSKDQILKHKEVDVFVIYIRNTSKDGIFEGLMINENSELSMEDNLYKDYYKPFKGSITLSND